MSDATMRKITGGPGKFELIVSLVHGDYKHRNIVTFTVKRSDHSHKTMRLDVQINSLDRASGLDTDFNFTGFAGEKGKTCVIGEYSTQTRSGTVHEDHDAQVAGNKPIDELLY